MTVGRCLLLLALVCLMIAVFSYVAERLHVFPGMGWGLLITDPCQRRAQTPNEFCNAGAKRRW
jgi:hypothetical protein